MQILCLTSCSKEKLYMPANHLRKKDFQDPNNFQKKVGELKQFSIKAEDMYVSFWNKKLLKILTLLNHKYFGLIHLYYVSGGFGILEKSDKIVPYDFTFCGLSIEEIIKISKTLNISSKIKELFSQFHFSILAMPCAYYYALNSNPSILHEPNRIFLVHGAIGNADFPSDIFYHSEKYLSSDQISNGVDFSKILLCRIFNSILVGKSSFNLLFSDPKNLIFEE